MPTPEDTPRIELVLALGEALHRYGAPSHRLEDALTIVAQKLGLVEARFFSTPTSIFAAFGPVATARTCLVRVEPGEMDLEKLSDLHDLSVAIADQGDVDVDAARARVAAIVARPARWPAWATVASFATAAAASSVFLSGTTRDALAAALVGLLVGLVVVVFARVGPIARVAEPLAAALASAASVVVAHFVPGTTPYVLLLSGLVSLLPGLTLTTALRELATKHLAAGTARLMGALVVLLYLGFGVALGAQLSDLLPALPPVPETPWSLPTAALAVGVAALSFLVQLKARPSDAPWIVVFGALAYTSARASAVLVGPELGAFGGAFVVAAAANIWARVLDRPATVTLVPALLLLVPGSVGFKSVTAMLDRQTLTAVDAAFTMAFVATSLTAGVLLANASFPPRRPL